MLAEPTDCTVRLESQALDFALTTFCELLRTGLDMRHTYPSSPVCAIKAIE